MTSDEWFARLRKLKHAVDSDQGGVRTGLRPSRILGVSFDFSDYRPYEAGDDIRQIDWNVYGRTDKFYIKRYFDERERSISIYLDCSASMRVLEKKWETARILAASFSFIALSGDDRLTFVPVGFLISGPFRLKGIANAKPAFQRIVQLGSEGAGGGFAESLERSFSKTSDVAILISDGMEPLDRLSVLFRRIAPFSGTTRFLQLLSEEESEVFMRGDFRFVDSETFYAVEVSVSDRTAASYKKRLREHNEGIIRLCRQYGFSYLRARAEEDVRSILFGACKRNGWLE